MGGSWTKWYLILGSLDADKLFIMAVLLGSSLLNIAYLLPIVIRGFFMPNPDGEAPMKEAPINCVLPLTISALCTLLLFFGIQPIYQLLAPVVGVTLP